MDRTTRDFIASLSKALESGNSELVMEVVKAGGAKSKGIFSCIVLHAYLVFANLETIKSLKASEATVGTTEKSMTVHEVEGLDLKLVKLLVAVAEENVNWQALYDNPLYLVAAKGDLERVKFLVELKRLEVNKPFDYKTPLSVAAGNGHLEVVKFLVEVGAKIITDPNEDETHAVTPLHEAARFGHLEIVKFLVSTNVDIIKTLERGIYPGPLYSAIEGGHLEIVKYLVEEQGVNIEKEYIIYPEKGKLYFEEEETEEEEMYPLHVAAANGHIQIVKYLVERGTDVNKHTCNDHTALYLAAKNNHLKVIEFLLDNGAEIKVDAWATPLHVAARSGNLEVIKYFVSKDANIIAAIEANDDGSSILSDAAIGGNLELMKFILAHGVDIETICSSDLEDAAENGHLEVVKFFLERGFNNCVDEIGAKPFLHAARNGHLEVLKFFLEYGVDIRTSDEDRDTALHYAAIVDQPKVIEFLLERRLDIDISNLHRKTPLHYAVEGGRLQATKILLKREANIQAKTRYDGHTVLMMAIMAYYGYARGTAYEILHCLLKYKADINAIDNEGKTALDHAVEKNCRKIPILLLSNAGGKITDSMLDRLPISTNSMVKDEPYCSSLEKAWGILNILNTLMESQKEHAIAIRETWSKELIPIIQEASSSIVDQSMKQGSNIFHLLEEKGKVLKLQKDIKTLSNKDILSELSDQLKKFLVSTEQEIQDLDKHLLNPSCHAFKKAAEGLATKEDKDGSTLKNKKAADVLVQVGNADGLVKNITSFLDPKDHGKFLIATGYVKDQHLIEDVRSFQDSEPENSRAAKHHCASASSEKVSLSNSSGSVEKMDVEDSLKALSGDVCSHHSDTIS